MKRVHVRGQGHTHLTYVESDTKRDTEYEIVRRPDGTLKCACIAYVFSKTRPQSCKHLDAYLSTHATIAAKRRQLRGSGAGTVVRADVQTVVGAETFTFRGISFSDDLAVPS